MPVDATADVLSVADFDRRLRRAVEGLGSAAWVYGEVGSCKPAGSGHLYFTLRDEREDASLECVMYRAQVQRARGVVRDGARVQLRGQATLWAPRGRLQFVVDAARPAGRGELLEALERLKEKLEGEGLFAPARKRALPKQARTIGVVTSSSGAAIHDIAKVAFSRGAVRILLAPAIVQGDMAPASLLKALDLLERVRSLDVVIIGRGGGAAEDLAAFQDERVVRRVASFRVPVVSAVGHEIDVTLTDLVADARAATPSHAAEMLVPDAAARETQLASLARRLSLAMRAHLGDDRLVLERLERRLGDPHALVDRRYERVDDLQGRLAAAASRALVGRRQQILRLDSRLSARHPRAVLALARGMHSRLDARLVAVMRQRLSAHHAALAQAAHRLDALSPLAVLGRGYAITTDSSGRPLLRAAEAPVGTDLTVRLHEGKLHVRVIERPLARLAEGLSTMKSLRFAVVGHPIKHSASPAMHHAAFTALSLPHSYLSMEAKDVASLSAVLAAMRKGVLAGVNVTAPHKSTVLELVDRVDPLVETLGAANTIVRHFDGALVACNTDAPALLEQLRALAPKTSVALILGAGGAARAAMHACKELGVRVIVVTTRSWSTSESLYDSAAAEWFRKEGAMTVLWPTPNAATTSHLSSAIRLQWWDLAQGADLVIQATSAGGEGGPGGLAVAATVPWDRLPKTAVACELRYGAVETPFLQAARRVGLRAEDGIGLLVGQGALAFELWNASAAPRGVMELAARAHVASQPSG